jgi:tryptophanyl-tRNA synthetase
MRDIAERFNERFGELLVPPAIRTPEVGARIMDLQDPTSKMSTTAPSPAGTLSLLDDDRTLAKKVRSAVTDSGSEVRRAPDKPGISNLIEILAVVRGVEPNEIEREFDGQGYGAFKGSVADAVVDYVRPIRERYERLRPDEAALEATLSAGADRAEMIASQTLEDVRAAMGVG